MISCTQAQPCTTLHSKQEGRTWKLVLNARHKYYQTCQDWMDISDFVCTEKRGHPCFMPIINCCTQWPSDTFPPHIILVTVPKCSVMHQSVQLHNRLVDKGNLNGRNQLPNNVDYLSSWYLRSMNMPSEINDWPMTRQWPTDLHRKGLCWVLSCIQTMK